MNTATATNTANLAERWAECLPTGDLSGGPQWLDMLRQGAAREFRRNGLPGNKDEAWKYTSLQALEKLHPALGFAAAETSVPDWVPLLPRAGGFGFRFHDGRLQLLEEQAPPGVSIVSLAELLSRPGNEQLDHLRPLMEAIDVSGRGHAFQALNTAALSGGIVIHVAAGVDAGWCQARWGLNIGAMSRLLNFRLIIMLEAGARLRLLEQYPGPARAAGAQADSRQKHTGQALNLVLQAQLAAGATLEHVRCQKESSSSILLTFTEVDQAARSCYAYHGFDLGGGVVRHGINCRLSGPGARAGINGAFVLDQERHVDHHICVDHLAPSCDSEQFFRGVLGGHSRGVFNGKAVIRPGADGSRVRQSNANLLLSRQAEIDTKPELEIYADEVEASHGATVGSLDEGAVFYLRSRGLSEMAARRMLTTAFCRMVTARLPDSDMAGQIADLLEDSMPELELNLQGKN